MTANRQAYLKRGYRTVGGWLFPYSATFIDEIGVLQRRSGITGAVGEIGVHHGKLFILMALGRHSGEQAIAIDIFDDQHLNLDGSGAGDRAIFEDNMQRWLGRDEDVTILQRSSFDVCPADILDAVGPLRLASIDGGHTEDCVINDFGLIESVLAPKGVVILDDYFNEYWPDVASGVARYLLDPGARLRPFAITPNKTYFTFAGDVPFYRGALRGLCGYHYEKTARIFGCDVDIYGTQAFTFSLKKRLIEWVKTTPAAPYARALRAAVRNR